ncbi:hypothetical protein SAMN03159371_06548 [Variovorax sp. NFACC28]|nr:hypothetical protein [Variovorax paradoxus]SEF33533.1 hypothetical protein SAMN03159371_06548 [Variovorax sp. NFACC28]SEG97339.1 hypothetical protein SAMN03159365_06835 [Variovorax sp. NFACC29]SFD90057.1 hypothetical protein SAMN03159379_06688 [Variovorax sp. NFACC26]SFH06181.1 hypothetical protein SAMN03159447_06370 [Variovorax sp. NFACC27]
MGVKHPHLEELLRDLLIEEAQRSWRAQGVPRPNLSQLSITTGLNRKAVTAKVRATSDPLPHTELSAAAKTFTLWLQMLTQNDSFRRLPITAGSATPSFEAVARMSSRGDVHHRTILDELVRLNMVSEEEGVVELTTDGFVPVEDLQSMLAFLGDNGRDHLLAAVSNTLGDEPRMLERAVYARGLTLQECEQIQRLVRERWAALHHELAQEMTQAVDRAPSGSTGRIRVGIYTYYQDENVENVPAPPPRPPD